MAENRLYVDYPPLQARDRASISAPFTASRPRMNAVGTGYGQRCRRHTRAAQKPHGRPSRCQAAKKIVHTTMSTRTYGSMSATTVPTPASFWYFWANVTISTKYAFMGVMALIGESPTR